MSTSKSAQRMILTTFMLPAGYHKDSWRMEGSRAEELGNLDFVLELTQMAEAAKLDAIFFGDVVHANTLLRGDIKMNGFYEPVSVLSALAARTVNGLGDGLWAWYGSDFAEANRLLREPTKTPLDLRRKAGGKPLALFVDQRRRGEFQEWLRAFTVSAAATARSQAGSSTRTPPEAAPNSSAAAMR